MILTFNQYVDKQRRQAREEYGLSASDAQRFYPPHGLRSAWWKYVLEAFEAGEDFSPQALVTLTPSMMRELSRTTRGLRQGLPNYYLDAAARKVA